MSSGCFATKRWALHAVSILKGGTTRTVCIFITRSHFRLWWHVTSTAFAATTSTWSWTPWISFPRYRYTNISDVINLHAMICDDAANFICSSPAISLKLSFSVLTPWSINNYSLSHTPRLSEPRAKTYNVYRRVPSTCVLTRNFQVWDATTRMVCPPIRISESWLSVYGRNSWASQPSILWSCEMPPHGI